MVKRSESSIGNVVSHYGIIFVRIQTLHSPENEGTNRLPKKGVA